MDDIEIAVVNVTRMTVELMKKMLSLQLSFGTNHTIITPMVKREAMKLSADISIIGMRLNILAKESQVYDSNTLSMHYSDTE